MWAVPPPLGMVEMEVVPKIFCVNSYRCSVRRIASERSPHLLLSHLLTTVCACEDVEQDGVDKVGRRD